MTGPSCLHLSDRRVDLARRAVVGPGGTERLTPLEHRFLVRLLEAGGRTVSRAALLRDVWGYHAALRTRADSLLVVRLRRKLEVDPARPVCLLTVTGVGYRLHLSATEDAADAAPLSDVASLLERARRACIGDGDVEASTVWEAADRQDSVDLRDALWRAAVELVARRAGPRFALAELQARIGPLPGAGESVGAHRLALGMEELILRVSLGDLDAAEALAERVMHHAAVRGDRQILGACLDRCATIARRRGDFERSEQLLLDALSHCAEDTLEGANALHNLGMTRLHLGRTDEARGPLDAARRCFDRLGAAVDAGNVVVSTASLALDAGRTAEAHRLAEQAAQQMARHGYARAEVHARTVVGLAHLLGGEPVAGAGALRRVVHLSERHGFVHECETATRFLGCALVLSGRSGEAVPLWRDAARRSPDDRMVARWLARETGAPVPPPPPLAAGLRARLDLAVDRMLTSRVRPPIPT
ncbi:MAG: winged helix-turn-helix domain-containing protein [Alphaproteobacteria bacterium]|nr:winged helix-turn-helix domain-containing protein [Alphaproteobacteria bacterium]